MTTKPTTKSTKAPVITLLDEKNEKIINYIMRHGKKSVARNIFKNMLEALRGYGHSNPQTVLDTAIENAAPTIMVKSKRVGGAIYQVPMEVKGAKKVFFAIKWILDAAKGKKGKPIHQKLADEFLAAYSNQGSAVKRKEEVHKMAEANRAFAYLAKYFK